MDAKDILIDGFERLPRNVHIAVRRLTPDQLRWAPTDGSNPIGWLIWHLTRIQDDHVADVMDDEQIYVTGDWAGRFASRPTPRRPASATRRPRLLPYARSPPRCWRGTTTRSTNARCVSCAA
jgi:hypothetical protein